MSPRTMPSSSVSSNLRLCVVCFLGGGGAIKSLQGIIVLGTVGLLLLVSHVTGAVPLVPLWQRSASPGWSTRLPRTLATSLAACSSAAAVTQFSGQAITMSSAWTLNGGRWVVIAVLSPVCSECVSWTPHCNGSPHCPSRHPCRGSVWQDAMSPMSSMRRTGGITVGMSIVCVSGLISTTKTRWMALLGRSASS